MVRDTKAANCCFELVLSYIGMKSHRLSFDLLKLKMVTVHGIRNVLGIRLDIILSKTYK